MPNPHVCRSADQTYISGYYNEARILNPVTFDTITQLPNMPGAVNNFLAGRNYPMEGTAVLLPQYPPYTDPIEILICGGSTPGAAIALDNCISIAPEVENPTWTLERMVCVCVDTGERGFLTLWTIWYSHQRESCHAWPRFRTGKSILTSKYIRLTKSLQNVHDLERCRTRRRWLRTGKRPQPQCTPL